MKKDNVYQLILTVAEALIQKVGFNAFSYRDIAEKVGVKTSSIHYYFPTKSDLGQEVVIRHKEQAAMMLTALLAEPGKSYKAKLETYLETIFANTYQKERKMCLGGMLAADVLTLEKEVQEEVKAFFVVNEQFLKELLDKGKEKGEFSFKGGSLERAKSVMAILEGALLFARLYKDETRLQGAKKQIIEIVS